MAVITTRLIVDAEGSISAAGPSRAREYLATLEEPSGAVRTPAAQPFDLDPIPELDIGPWRQAETFRREDIYGDDGR